MYRNFTVFRVTRQSFPNSLVESVKCTLSLKTNRENQSKKLKINQIWLKTSFLEFEEMKSEVFENKSWKSIEKKLKIDQIWLKPSFLEFEEMK